jgi:FG-GAP-like repeat/FG-GAP repeat
VAAGDFNGDGKPDLAVAGFEGRIAILLGNSMGSFDRAGSTHVALDSPNPLAVGDFNGDSNLDLAVGVSTLMPPLREVVILLGAGTGFFSSSNSFAVGVSPEFIALAAGDFNGDGKLDLAVSNGSSSNVSVGAAGMITASADTGSASLPVNISLCQTDPATAQCISAIGDSVTTQINANAMPTFGVFVQCNGNVPFDPAVNRVLIRFRDTGGGITRGSTSVAVRTQ